MYDISFLRVFSIIIACLFGIIFLIKKNKKNSNFFTLITYLVLFVLLSVVGSFPQFVFDIGLLLNFGEDERAGFFILILTLFSFLILSIINISDSKDNLEKMFIRFFIDNTIKSFNFKKIPKSDILIIIPSFNELKNLKILLKKIPVKFQNLKATFIVVDDGSNDGTEEFLKKQNYNFLKIPFNAGQGFALKVGYELASKINIKYVVTMDADNQHLPSDISEMLKPLLSNKADIVIGSRILGKNLDQQKIRSFGISFFSFLIYILTKFKINDISSGFKCFNTQILKKIDLQEYQYQSAEFLLSSIKAKYRIVEVPITIYKRKFGDTKKGISLNYAIGFFKSILWFFFRK